MNQVVSYMLIVGWTDSSSPYLP